MKYLLLFAIVEYATALNLLGRTQSVAAEGSLVCNGKPAANVLVKLYDSDNSVLPGVLDTDDMMGSTRTDSKGHFKVSGHTKEFTRIEPYLAIYHNCDDGFKPCKRAVRIGIPKKWVTKAKTPTKVFNVGQLNLSIKYANEKRSCLTW